MTAQPDGLHPDLKEIYIAEHGWGYRLYKTEKKARQYAYKTVQYVRDEQGRAMKDEKGKYLTLPTDPPEIYRVKLTWEKIADVE